MWMWIPDGFIPDATQLLFISFRIGSKQLGQLIIAEEVFFNIRDGARLKDFLRKTV
jgi:hypothetical protein